MFPKMSLPLKSLLFEKADLVCPPLEEVAKVLEKGLSASFKSATVEVVDCPDLTQEPFHLTSKGLGGSPSLLEIGGPPYLLPLVKRDKVYDLKEVPELLGSKSVAVIGAGAGPWPYAGTNCEGVFNLSINNGKVTNGSRIGKVDPATGTKHHAEILPDNETRCALLANLFCSEGKTDKVLKVHCKGRTDDMDFITTVKLAIHAKYKDQPIGFGGAFLLKEGKVKQHVMPDFSKTPINSDEDLNKWLKFFEMSAPLVAVGTFATCDPGLDLRLQHFHSFGLHGEAGHYHYDTTPETVEYLGYFSLAKVVYRLDRPAETHQFGRD